MDHAKHEITIITYLESKLESLKQLESSIVFSCFRSRKHDLYPRINIQRSNYPDYNELNKNRLNP